MSMLIYGSTGYTGNLIARLARDYGLNPILAGRNKAKVEQQAKELDLEHRVFDINHAQLRGVTVVLHCAGPFFRTSAQMATSCIKQRAHYIDITGEIEVFEQLHGRDEEARKAGVMLLPGAGFDVVPTDCLAAHLKQRLPTATKLMLGISGGSRLSHGTASTMVEHAHRGGMIRRGGVLTRVPTAWRTREIDFGNGPQSTVTIPWGDVATSYYSTGIPDVEVYSAVPPKLKPLLFVSRYLGWLTRRRWVKDFQLKRIPEGGPSEQDLRAGRCACWGRVEDEAGNAAEARLSGPNAYLLTAHTALMIAKRALDGDVRVGYSTPSLAYGADFVLGCPAVTRTDL